MFPKHIKWPEWWWPGGGLGDTIAHSIVDLLCKNSNFYVFWLMRQPSNCRIPSDHIPIRSWPLFLARELMRDLIETLKAEQST